MRSPLIQFKIVIVFDKEQEKVSTARTFLMRNEPFTDAVRVEEVVFGVD
jgi:hypothetical protein